MGPEFSLLAVGLNMVCKYYHTRSNHFLYFQPKYTSWVLKKNGSFKNPQYIFQLEIQKKIQIYIK